MKSALALMPMDKEVNLHHLLVITTTVNLVIQMNGSETIIYILMIHYGMASSVTNTPPWFSVQLPAPTNDKIQVSICGDQSTTDEDTPVELIEIYVQ